MEVKTNRALAGGMRNHLTFFFGLLTITFSSFAGEKAMERSRTTTNTDTNADGSSDGNIDTYGKDYENKTKEAIRISSINIRASSKDANCFAGTGAACSTNVAFEAKGLAGHTTQLAEEVNHIMSNQANMRGFKRTTDGTEEEPITLQNICSEIPGTFGCARGDFALLASARESLEFSIKNGDPVLSPGTDADGFLARVDSFIGKLNEAREKVLQGFNGALNMVGIKPIEPSTDAGDDSNQSSGLYSYDDYARGNQTGAMSATFGKQDWVGPTDLSELSAHIDIMNGLDAVDRQSGKTLTLWQRATRRYQSFDLSRAYTLAKTEGARGQLMSTRAPASSKK